MLRQQPFEPRLRQEGDGLKRRWAEAAAQTKALKAQVERLVVRAPFAGRVAEASEGLAVGAWVAEREWLFVLVGASGTKGQAFVSEAQLKRLRSGPHASVFIPDALERSTIRCRTSEIDHVNISKLDIFPVASVYGGSIAVERDHLGALLPTRPLFRVRLEDCNAPAPLWELRGVAHLEGERSSVAGRWVRHGFALIQREMGF
jgi:putative peptide zinc metalloprotease protein